MISDFFFYSPLLINWPKMSDVAKIKTHMCKLMFNLLLLKQFSDYFTFEALWHISLHIAQ